MNEKQLNEFMSERNLELVQTCFACPEQYELYHRGHEIGYLRLRHGSFRADYKPTDETVYEIKDIYSDNIFD